MTDWIGNGNRFTKPAQRPYVAGQSVLRRSLEYIDDEGHNPVSPGRRSILLVFLDGVGLGADDPRHNPFARLRLPGFSVVSGVAQWTAAQWTAMDSADDPGTRRCTRSLDATLGVAGLPQSGTGQATLFTGVNCARIAGRHYGPYPHSATRAVIRERNVFVQIQDGGGSAAFANAYPPGFFERAQTQDRWTVTTRCCIDAGVRIRSTSEMPGGTAIPADLTGGLLRRRDPTVSASDESHSARVLSRIAREHDFVLFEYFLTDKAGHRQNHGLAAEVLESVDRFLAALDRVLDYEQQTLLVTSDHGNLEDLSTKSHTTNRVPFLARGWSAPYFAEVSDLTGVTPGIVRALRSRTPFVP